MINMSSTWTEFWAVNVRYRATPNETRSEQTDRRRAERAILIEKGFPETEFKFKNTSPQAVKDRAKLEAEAYAKRAQEKTGVIVEVVEGSYL